MRLLWLVAAVLVGWAGVTMVRRMGEDRRADAQSRSGGQKSRSQVDGDDEIDREELERAEREVKDLDATTRPEDGFEGDDWGPGASRQPPVA